MQCVLKTIYCLVIRGSSAAALLRRGSRPLLYPYPLTEFRLTGICTTDGPALFEVPWTFKRQQRTVRMTYHFTQMLMYRGSLLNDFLCTAARTSRQSPPSASVQKCVDAAIHMATFAAKIAEDSSYNAVFWATSYFTFCAISILVVYLTLYHTVGNRAELEHLLECAMKGHKRLDQSNELEAQSLLEESHKLAMRTMGRDNADAAGTAASHMLQATRGVIPSTSSASAIHASASAGPEIATLPGYDLGSSYDGSDMLHSLVWNPSPRTRYNMA
jgi:hypothetical protein